MFLLYYITKFLILLTYHTLTF